MGFFKSIGKIFKKAVPALIGGGLGFLTGGPMGATLGAAGGLFGGGGKEASQGVTDVRSAAERKLAQSQAKYFQDLMAKPDLGYQDVSAAEDPIYARAQERLKENIAGYAADKGFGILQHGPSVSTYGKTSQAMEENRAAEAIARRQAHKEWVMSGGRMAATPMGRSPYNIPGQESTLASMFGPAIGAYGAQQGPNIGQRFGEVIDWGKKIFGSPYTQRTYGNRPQ